MTDQDLELVLAYVAGQLSDDDAVAFEARIAADGSLAAEVRAQHLAREAMAGALPASLTAAERSELRRAVAAGLAIGDEPAGVARRPRRRLAPLAAVAGVAAVVVAGFVVVPALVGGGADTGGDTAALREADPTVVAEDGAAESSGGEAEDATTTVAASGDLSPMVPMVDEDYDLRRLAAQPEAGRYGSGDDGLVQVDLAAVEGCLERIGADLPGASDFVVVAVADGGDGRVFLVTYRDADGFAAAAAVDAATCRVEETARVGSDEGSG